MTDTEKVAAVIKQENESNTSDEYSGDYVPLSDTEFKRLRWKLDLRIVPFCGLLYLCSFLDRSNIGMSTIPKNAFDPY